MKKRVVVFTRNNARILTNVTFTPSKSSVSDPDLSKVKSIPPHYWKLKDGNVIEMSPQEKLNRDLNIRIWGVDNSIENESRFKKLYKMAALLSILAILVGFISLIGNHNARRHNPVLAGTPER